MTLEEGQIIVATEHPELGPFVVLCVLVAKQELELKSIEDGSWGIISQNKVGWRLASDVEVAQAVAKRICR